MILIVLHDPGACSVFTVFMFNIFSIVLIEPFLFRKPCGVHLSEGERWDINSSNK